jgi:hypothetical protein
LLNRKPFDEDRAALEKAQDAARNEQGLRLLRGAQGLRGLTPQQVERIASRLDAAVVPVRRRSLLPILGALAILLSVGTAVAWATGALQRIPAVRALLTSTPIAKRAPPAKSSVNPTANAAPTEREDPASNPRPGEDPRAMEAPRGPPIRKRATNAPSGMAGRQERAVARESRDPPTRAPAISDSSIAQEGESFASILRSWRRDRDGQAGLSALDLHDRRFAEGQMALESRLLRVEILLSQRRDREALAVLDRLALGTGNVPRGRELLTVRGELRIKAGRCDDGRADLASIGGGTDGFAERARNALTYCR